ncbi:hypothetical protein R0131_16795 [Clostridium sp. AL.422]|uniref:hypothetical protein n=1 Tax=Clostridium TaxID=1485 RepID=UPI00293DF828|nr:MULTISPECIES: hypothetical protein [unclassified Clostridium]MDV4152487.1 hypothetical protein [Clostridium sp. AL.422]
MNSDENRIVFNEIKTYEEAYFYNSDPIERIKYEKSEVKIEKKKSKFSEKLLEGIGEIAEGILELVFSFLD